MRKLRVQYTNRQVAAIRNTSDPPAPEPMRANTFPALVEEVANLSTVNYGQMMFFRGQSTDYQNREGKTSLYPSIYRGDYLSREEVVARFEVLEAASEALVNSLSLSMKHNAEDLHRRKYIRWALLQHYEVCPTPFLDITHSLHVACTFAVIDNDSTSGFVYVLGLPYTASRIAMDAEEDLVNVRLLSICPPEALRPHFQEALVAGTLDITSRYDDKSELDFSRRLVMKFEIPTNTSFWTEGFGPIPRNLLFPDQVDTVLQGLSDIKEFSRRMARPGDIGRFIEKWARLEVTLQNRQLPKPKYVASVGSAIQTLVRNGQINRDVASKIENLRIFRNRLVHRTAEVEQREISRALATLEETIPRLDK